MPGGRHPENVSPYTGLRVPVCKGTYTQEGGGLMLQGYTMAMVPCGNPTPKKLPTGRGEWPTFRTARAQRTVRPHSVHIHLLDFSWPFCTTLNKLVTCSTICELRLCLWQVVVRWCEVLCMGHGWCAWGWLHVQGNVHLLGSCISLPACHHLWPPGFTNRNLRVGRLLWSGSGEDP